MAKEKNRYYLTHKDTIIVRIIEILSGIALIALGFAFYYCNWKAF